MDADKSSSIMYSIKFGNEKQLFKIDQSSGEIFIISPNGLQRSKNNITLTIVVSIYIIYPCLFLIIIV